MATSDSTFILEILSKFSADRLEALEFFSAGVSADVFRAVARLSKLKSVTMSIGSAIPPELMWIDMLTNLERLSSLSCARYLQGNANNSRITSATELAEVLNRFKDLGTLTLKEMTRDIEQEDVLRYLAPVTFARLITFDMRMPVY